MAEMKNIKIGNREKIVIGLVAMLLVIALTHFLLYSSKSKELKQVNEEYNAALTQYQDFASKNLPAAELKKVQTNVKKMDTVMKTAIDKFQIGGDKDMSTLGGDVFLKKLDDIKTMEKNSNKPKISVLASWMISDEIPGLENSRIPDYLNQLRDKKGLLSMISKDTTDLKTQMLRQQFEAQYQDVLMRLGFNKTELDKLPPFIAWLKQLKLLTFIFEHRGASDVQKLRDLVMLIDIPAFDPNFAKSGMYFMNRTKEVLDIATQAQLDSISDVKMMTAQDVRPVKKSTATPTPQAGIGPGAGMIDEFMMGPGGPGRGGRGFNPFGMMGGVKPTPTAPPEPATAVSIPIQVVVVGDNLAIMRFLYGVTHSASLMDIKEVEINTQQEEGKLQAKVTINCYKDVKAIEALAKAPVAAAAPAAPAANPPAK